MFLLFATLFNYAVNASVDLNCTVEWCCAPAMRNGNECHVKNATEIPAQIDGDGNIIQNATCDCNICEDGWFRKVMNNSTDMWIGDPTNCDSCSGRGLAIYNYEDEMWPTCTCEGRWIGSTDAKCDICPQPYGGENCEQCAEGVEDSSYPSCNICEDGYFADPRNHDDPTMPKCLPAERCTVDFCISNDTESGMRKWEWMSGFYFNSYENGVVDATFSNGDCSCGCGSGYFGPYEQDQDGGDQAFWLACQACKGRGESYDPTAEHGEMCDCRSGWRSHDDVWKSNNECGYCPYGFEGDDCDRCKADYSGYPNCELDLGGGFVGSPMYWVIIALVCAVGVAFWTYRYWSYVTVCCPAKKSTSCFRAPLIEKNEKHTAELV